MARRTADEAARTRESILDAGLIVFAERGYAAAQLEDISKRARVTRGAFYHHFENKAELYIAVLKERWAQVMSPLLLLLQGKTRPQARLHAFIAAFIRTMDADPKARALLQMSLSGDSTLPEFQAGLQDKSDALAGWRTALAQVFEEAGHRSDAARRALALMAFLNGIAITSALDSKLVPAASDAEKLADLVLGGLLDVNAVQRPPGRVQ